MAVSGWRVTNCQTVKNKKNKNKKTVTKLAKQSVLYDREVNDPFEHVQYAEDE